LRSSSHPESSQIKPSDGAQQCRPYPGQWRRQKPRDRRWHGTQPKASDGRSQRDIQDLPQIFLKSLATDLYQLDNEENHEATS